MLIAHSHTSSAKFNRSVVSSVAVATSNDGPGNSADALHRVLALGQSRIVREGMAIHRVSDPLRSLFFLRTGVAKRIMLQEDGREQILGFPLPGEILGLEAMGNDQHSSTVSALDMCAVVEVPYAALEALMARDNEVAKFIYQRISAALREEHGWLAALGLLTAEERVAAFLLDLSRRFAARGFSDHRFLLRMTRAEIGGFLGLTLETVSRVFSKFQRSGVLAVERREIEILDMNRLSSIGLCRVMH